MKTIVAAKRYFPLMLNYNNCFKDVGMDWYAPSICFAKEKGWIKGYDDGTFHPQESLTKAESLKIILEAFNVVAVEDRSHPMEMFADLEKNTWYYPYIETALILGLIDDNPNLELYYPDNPALRGDIAQIIYRVLQLQM